MSNIMSRVRSLGLQIVECERNVARLDEHLNTCCVSWEYERVADELDQACSELNQLRAREWVARWLAADER